MRGKKRSKCAGGTGHALILLFRFHQMNIWWKKQKKNSFLSAVDLLTARLPLKLTDDKATSMTSSPTGVLPQVRSEEEETTNDTKQRF